MAGMYVSHHLSGFLPSSYSQSFLLPDVVTWLAPTCDVVNTSSAPTAFRRLCYWLMLVPFSTMYALPRTLHHNILWLRPRSQINHFTPWAAYDCMAFCSVVCQDTSPLLSSLLELLSVWVEYILAEGVLLRCVADGLHCGINLEMNTLHYGSLWSVNKDWDWCRYWWSLGTVNAAEETYNVRIMAGIATVSLCSGWLLTTCCYYCILRIYLYFWWDPVWMNPRMCQQSAYKSLEVTRSSSLSNDNWTKLITKKKEKTKPKQTTVEAVLTPQSSRFPVYIW